jgi:uncharacterized protein (DUF4213/DUF364 family)
MKIDGMIFDTFADEAAKVKVEQIVIGLGYSAVLLDDGRCGLCCTLAGSAGGCLVNKDPVDYEQRSAIELLKLIRRDALLSRVLAIATANALNQSYADGCSDDKGNLISDLHLKRGDKVAMVGHFDPVTAYFERNGISLGSYDLGKDIGDEESFYRWVVDEADAMVLTATSVTNGTTEEVFEHLQGKAFPIAMMGPSTIMRPEVYAGSPISICAGSVVLDPDSVIRVVRNGKGTRDILKHARKVQLFLK